METTTSKKEEKATKAKIKTGSSKKMSSVPDTTPKGPSSQENGK